MSVTKNCDTFCACFLHAQCLVILHWRFSAQYKFSQMGSCTLFNPHLIQGFRWENYRMTVNSTQHSTVYCEDKPRIVCFLWKVWTWSSSLSLNEQNDTQLCSLRSSVVIIRYFTDEACVLMGLAAFRLVLSTVAGGALPVVLLMSHCYDLSVVLQKPMTYLFKQCSPFRKTWNLFTCQKLVHPQCHATTNLWLWLHVKEKPTLTISTKIFRF